MLRRIYSVTFAVMALSCAGADDLPIVPEGFTVDVVAKEPIVRNPCVMAFDRLGRICVAQGQQWRAPTPETPGDRVDILIDSDGDGAADGIKTFAEGFNSVQGIAWHGGDLWVANAPDLTLVRDTDGDDEADLYIKVYTGLGNLEHSLHGLNFGPDGKLYMSKGNSKGYNRLDQLAPKAFRDLWGLASPAGAPDYTEVEVFTKETYRRAYHTPNDDWGQQGGILRCDPYAGSDAKQSHHEMGRHLEIFSRGFRNPWDICFDDGFEWLGTDNDQTEGDKVFAPFHGAHFGWGHPWSFDWKGIDHLPTVPISMPLYEGSGAGVIHYHSTHFRPNTETCSSSTIGCVAKSTYSNLNGTVHFGDTKGVVFRVSSLTPKVVDHCQRVLVACSSPRILKSAPTARFTFSVGGTHTVGTIKDGKQVDAGRVYRIRHIESDLVDWKRGNRSRPLSQWTLQELLADLGSSVPCLASRCAE